MNGPASRPAPPPLCRENIFIPAAAAAPAPIHAARAPGGTNQSAAALRRSSAWPGLPLFPEPTGVGRGRRRRPTGPRLSDTGEAPGGRAQRASGPAAAGRLLPVAPHGAGRGENQGHGASCSRGPRAPHRPGGSTPGPRDSGWGMARGAPGPAAPPAQHFRSRLGARARLGAPRPDSAPQPRAPSCSRAPGRALTQPPALGWRGCGPLRRGRAPGSPPLPPRGPSERRKEPIVRREIHFWGPSESPSFF